MKQCGRLVGANSSRQFLSAQARRKFLVELLSASAHWFRARFR